MGQNENIHQATGKEDDGEQGRNMQTRSYLKKYTQYYLSKLKSYYTLIVSNQDCLKYSYWQIKKQK